MKVLKTLSLEKIGQIERAQVSLGDLTVLVGPQASGKSVFLQFLKLVADSGVVVRTLKQYGLDWGRDTGSFLDLYLGEGMRAVWREGQSTIRVNGDAVPLSRLLTRYAARQKLFFIPAQRVLTLGKGWPRPFADYSAGDPFAVRDFSEKLRLQMEVGLGRGEAIFPQKRRLKTEIRELLRELVFLRFALSVDTHGAQKRLVLRSAVSAEPLPFMVWSAGQREFVPLLLGMYWLLPPTKVSRRAGIEWVVVEELEMGLHPQAISAVMALVLDLLARGYRVCLSTHSSHVLDVVWALRVFQQNDSSPDDLLDLFRLGRTQTTRRLADAALGKQTKVYFFDVATGEARDISNLDPGAAETVEAGWGGLTEFSGRVADAVARVVSRSPGRESE